MKTFWQALAIVVLIIVPFFCGIMTVSVFAAEKTVNPHVIAERLAHDYVYSLGKGAKGRDSMKTDRYGRELIEKNKGFEILDTIDDPDVAGGFAAMALKDPKSGNIFIVFRGTDTAGDAIKDYASLTRGQAEVGRNQYEHFQDRLSQWADRYSQEGKLIVTGHSLGGAIAQRFTADHPDKVAEMVLFQAPGVEEDVAKKFDDFKGPKPKTTLYVAEHDIVHDVGTRHVTGTNGEVVVAHVEGVEAGDRLKSHCSFLLQEHGEKGLRWQNFKEWDYDQNGRPSLKKITPEKFSKMRGVNMRDNLAKVTGQATLVLLSIIDATTGKPVPGIQVSVAGGGKIEAGTSDRKGGVCLEIPFLLSAQKVIVRAIGNEGYENYDQAFTTEQKGRFEKTISLKSTGELSLQGPREARVGEKCRYTIAPGPEKDPPLFGWFVDAKPLADTGNTIAVTWTKPGTSVVEVAVTKGVKVGKKAWIEVEVAPEDLSATISGPTRATVGDSAVYSLIAVKGGMAPYSYSWTVGDDMLESTEPSVVINWDKPGAFPLTAFVADALGTTCVTALEVTVKPVDPAKSAEPAEPAQDPLPPPVQVPVKKSGVWTLVDTKFYQGDGGKSSQGSADVDRDKYSYHASWNTPPAELTPGDELSFKVSVTFTESNTAHGGYIGGRVTVDREEEGVAPGSATRGQVVIANASTDYNKSRHSDSGTGMYKVPAGNSGKRFQLRFMLSDGAPPFPGTCFIYEYR